MFSKFAKLMGNLLGHSITFSIACFAILLWFISGFFFQFSDTWQLVINTITDVVAFLMVFILQNTQNRSTATIQLKLDELIRAVGQAHNELVKVEDLSDDELKRLGERYENLALTVKNKIKKGESDEGSPNI